MFIKETGVQFNTMLDIGKFGFAITLDDYGVNIDIKDLLKQTEHFSRIIIKGEEPFTQRDEVAKFIKKLSKANPNTIFEVHTNGTVRPLGLQSVGNIIYYVNLQLKSSNKKYEDRIKNQVVTWYNELQANFVFHIRSDDDFDDIEMLVQEFAIKKAQITLIPDSSNEYYLKTLVSILNFVKIRGYNYSVDVERLKESE